MTRKNMATINMSDIIRQVESDNVFLENMSDGFRYHSGMNKPENKKFILLFRNINNPKSNPKFNWYYMYVWFLPDSYTGYLRDTICPYLLNKDKSYHDLQEVLNERYVMAKISGDSLITDGYNYEEGDPFRYHFRDIMNFHYDKRCPEDGYFMHDRHLYKTPEERENLRMI